MTKREKERLGTSDEMQDKKANSISLNIHTEGKGEREILQKRVELGVGSREQAKEKSVTVLRRYSLLKHLNPKEHCKETTHGPKG